LKIQQFRYLRGPNVHAPCPILEITVAADAAFAQRVIDLQRQAGVAASFQRVLPNMIAVECPIESLGRAAAEMAATGTVDVQTLKHLEYAERLPSSTAVVYHAARRRNIPARKLSSEYGRFLMLGHGSRQHRCQASEPDSVSAVARTASTDKYLAKQLMTAAGVPVPVGRIVDTVEDAWKAAGELGFPLAIKPQDSDLQIGVSLDLTTREQVEAAFKLAQENSRWVLVEQFAPGVEHRVLVVDGKIVAVTSIDPPLVMGDDVHTVQQLIDEVNSDPRRGDDSSGKPWHKLKLDDIAIGVLRDQRLTIASVPAKGQRVLVRRQPPYFKHGGNLVDLTDVIHPSIVAHCAAACEALQLRVAGLDVVVVDIRQPLEPQRGVVVEINAGPGLWLHLAPWASSPRPVGDAIVASMFPPGDEGRIPVIALVTDGSTDIDAITAALPGRLVGIATGDTIHVAGRQWPITGNPHERAQQLFQYPGIELAVLQTTPDELLEHGFGNDRCEAAVVQVPEGDFMAAVRHSLVPGSAVVGSWDEVKVAGLPVK